MIFTGKEIPATYINLNSLYFPNFEKLSHTLVLPCCRLLQISLRLCFRLKMATSLNILIRSVYLCTYEVTAALYTNLEL